MCGMSIILDVECIACNKTLQKINHDPGETSRKMGKITKRRSRTPNWSLEEKQYLLELIKDRKELVVTKSNNGPNHSVEKDVAWNEILYQLGLKFGDKFSGFSIKKVKTQWQNMKRIAREEIILNGASLLKCTKQSQEVCGILESQNAADLKFESEKNESLNETKMHTDVEIKTESIDEEMNNEEKNHPSGSSFSYSESQQNKSNEVYTLESSASSTSVHSDMNEDDSQEEGLTAQEDNNNKKKVNTDADDSSFNNILNLSTFHREFGAFLRYSATEKEIKLEALTEERQIVRAMRETAELNKIIAEQRLKHVLWIKKQEMAMYSGEPGSGAGKGGGGGGAIREAGGSFGKMEAVREDEYFYKKQREQLQNIKGHLNKEISFHQEQIKRHEDAIRRHKEQMAEMPEK